MSTYVDFYHAQHSLCIVWRLVVDPVVDIRFYDALPPIEVAWNIVDIPVVD